jgi:lipopolysaccharide heptosyltransferase II
MKGRRYLIVKLSALGDVAMASTLPLAIHRRDPEAHVTWLCGAGVADLVRLFPGVSEVLVADDAALFGGGFLRRASALMSAWGLVVGRRFDQILVGHADWRFRALALPARSARVRSLSLGSSRHMLPIPGRYHGDEYARLLEDESRGPISGHWPLADVRPMLPPRSGRTAVGEALVPGGARNAVRETALKRWPIDSYREVAIRLRQAGVPVTLVGDAGDAWVRPYFENTDVRDEIGTHGLIGTLGLLGAADLVISHDTGPLHLARLVRAPVLALFGPTDPSQFAPQDATASVLWGGDTLACRPCYNGREFAACTNNLCMQMISVDTVTQRALAIVAHAPEQVLSSRVLA